MPLTQNATFSYTKFFYALDAKKAVVSDVEIREGAETEIGVVIPAIWFKNRRGTLVVTYGKFYAYALKHKEDGAVRTPEELIAAAILDLTTDNYQAGAGADAIANWDGERIWSSEALKWDEMVELHDEFDRVYTHFTSEKKPTVPEGYVGWFSTRA